MYIDEKPYKYDLCEYMAAWKGDLNRHKVMHTRETPHLTIT